MESPHSSEARISLFYETDVERFAAALRDGLQALGLTADYRRISSPGMLVTPESQGPNVLVVSAHRIALYREYESGDVLRVAAGNLSAQAADLLKGSILFPVLGHAAHAARRVAMAV